MSTIYKKQHLFVCLFFDGGGEWGGGTARQDYFTHFEPSQSQDGAKREIPEKNLQTTRKQNLACLTCNPHEARTAVRWRAI